MPSFTVPPVLQRRLISEANSSSASPWNCKPDTVVTVFPARPFTSLRIRTTPSCVAAAEFFPQVQDFWDRPHIGQRPPVSVEYTRREFGMDGSFPGGSIAPS
jgi:hypothetical protein